MYTIFSIDFCALKDWLEIFNYIGIIGGVLVALLFFPKNEAKKRAEERERAYSALNDHYLRFLELQIGSPGLGTNNYDDHEVWDQLNNKQKAQQILLFEYLISILERTHYFLCIGPNSNTDWAKVQWKTWDHWMSMYVKNPNFRRYWVTLEKTGNKSSYNKDFIKLITKKIKMQNRDHKIGCLFRRICG